MSRTNCNKSWLSFAGFVFVRSNLERRSRKSTKGLGAGSAAKGFGAPAQTPAQQGGSRAGTSGACTDESPADAGCWGPCEARPGRHVTARLSHCWKSLALLPAFNLRTPSLGTPARPLNNSPGPAPCLRTRRHAPAQQPAAAPPHLDGNLHSRHRAGQRRGRHIHGRRRRAAARQRQPAGRQQHWQQQQQRRRRH